MAEMKLACLVLVMFWLAVPSTVSAAVSEAERDFEACRVIAERTNAGRLHELSVPFHDPDTNTQAILERMDYPRYGQVAKVDLNGDGKPENVLESVQGTAHITEFEFFDAKWRPLQLTASGQDDGEDEPSSMDPGLVRVNGRVYMLGMNEERLAYLVRIDRDYVQHVVCEFEPAPEPIVEVVDSRNDRLCRAAQDGDLDYVVFDQLHALSGGAIVDAGIRESPAGELAARVDIDNDGQEEFVVQLHLASGRGRGCGATNLAVLNRARNAIDVARTELLPQGGCRGAEVRPFEFEGAVFLETKYPDGYPMDQHEVAQLKGGLLEPVCKFRVRVLNVVKGDVARQAALDRGDTAALLAQALQRPGLIELKSLIDSGALRQGEGALHIADHRTVLHEAIELRRDDALQLLLDHDVDPGLRSKAGSTPLWAALWRGSEKSVRLLLAYGASPEDIGKFDHTSIEEALQASAASDAKLELLLRHGASPDVPKALADVVAIKRNDALRLLLRYGADVRGERGAQLLTLARQARNVDGERMLRVAMGASACSPERTQACLPRALRQADERLNNAYTKRITQGSEADRKALRAEQRAWLARRNAQCRLAPARTRRAGWLAYVLADSERANCVLAMTKARAAALDPGN